jgi:TolB-like protein/Tfp pilus assembly protein PilF
MSDIFLSYNREDQAVARQFAEAFQREGFSVWWDATLRSGEAYDQVTERALKTAKAVVVLWSTRSVESRWVRAEATLADRNKTLVPAMIEPCDRPIMFELTQTADLSHWQGAATDPAWLSFLADVRRFVERARSSTDESTLASTAARRSNGAPLATAAVVPATMRSSAGERGDAPSLAVMPFANRSGLPEDDVFSIGMVEDIIDALSQGVYVRVLASTATARFRTSAMPDLKVMSRELDVRYILEGNVRRTGTSLRVTAQLVDAVGGAILWTQRFERPLAELAALQEELVLEVAAHLNTQVQRIEMERALKKPDDLTAWEAVMRAIAALRSINVAKISAFCEEARKAVALAPEYGLAHAVLARASANVYFASMPDDAAEVRRIRSHVDRALALDPYNALVLTHVSLALSHIGDPEEGLRRGQLAVRLHPCASEVHQGCAMACALLARPEETLAHCEADLKASPGAPSNSWIFGLQGFAHASAGRRLEALAAFDRSLALDPTYPVPLIFKALILHADGRAEEAREAWLRVREAEPAGTLAVWELAVNRILARSPLRQEFLHHLRALWAQSESTA